MFPRTRQRSTFDVRRHRQDLTLAKLTLVVFDHVCFHARVERQRHRRRRRTRRQTRRQTRRSLPSLKIGSVSTTFALPLAARRYIHEPH